MNYFGIENIYNLRYSEFIETHWPQIEEKLPQATTEEKLEAFTDYVRDIPMGSYHYTFFTKNALAEDIIAFSSTNFKSIGVLKVFQIFSKLKIWEEHQLEDLTNQQKLIEVILERPDLVEGWDHLVSQGVSIKINNKVFGDKFRFKTASDEREGLLDGQYGFLSTITN